MKNFNSVLEVSYFIQISIGICYDFLKIDKENYRIKTESGILLEKLNDILHKNDMSISVLGSISDQTLAGTISCGTHGTGDNFGIISTYVSVCPR